MELAPSLDGLQAQIRDSHALRPFQCMLNPRIFLIVDTVLIGLLSAALALEP